MSDRGAHRLGNAIGPANPHRSLLREIAGALLAVARPGRTGITYDVGAEEAAEWIAAHAVEATTESDVRAGMREWLDEDLLVRLPPDLRARLPRADEPPLARPMLDADLPPACLAGGVETVRDPDGHMGAEGGE